MAISANERGLYASFAGTNNTLEGSDSEAILLQVTGKELAQRSSTSWWNSNNPSAKKASKFRDWLDCSSMEIKPNVVAMEILAYLAYETVAQLVDLALLVRQDMVTKAGDPFSHAISATFIQYHNSAEGGQAALGNCSATTAAVPSYPAVERNIPFVLDVLGSLGGGSMSVRKPPD
ncbi:hypothetical protein P7K49_008061 [Saguinus oedipus]|uniref:Transcription initiation protein SPT3 homolog n=1 Tax=Saguinus oedipus TaxID=9490 RepID=A0ABQ9VWN7_SAGOE|nr:hypothetical protein P7K49_008061 [Saguinus oedipus]